MAKDDELVAVRRSHFDYMWQHCQRCPSFTRQWQALRHSWIVIPCTLSSDGSVSKREKKRRPPGRGLSQTSNKRRKIKDEARDSFLRNLPSASKWRERQIELGLHNVDEYEKVIRSLTSRSTVDVKQEPGREDSDELVAIGKNLALLTDASLRNKDLQKLFAYFQCFLLLSYCGALEKRGVSEEEIDRITQCVTSFREMDRRRLRTRAVKVNCIINDLVKGGRAIYQATEVFFISTFPRSIVTVD